MVVEVAFFVVYPVNWSEIPIQLFSIQDPWTQILCLFTEIGSEALGLVCDNSGIIGKILNARILLFMPCCEYMYSMGVQRETVLNHGVQGETLSHHGVQGETILK